MLVKRSYHFICSFKASQPAPHVSNCPINQPWILLCSLSNGRKCPLYIVTKCCLLSMMNYSQVKNKKDAVSDVRQHKQTYQLEWILLKIVNWISSVIAVSICSFCTCRGFYHKNKCWLKSSVLTASKLLSEETSVLWV